MQCWFDRLFTKDIHIIIRCGETESFTRKFFQRIAIRGKHADLLVHFRYFTVIYLYLTALLSEFKIGLAPGHKTVCTEKRGIDQGNCGDSYRIPDETFMRTIPPFFENSTEFYHDNL